MCQVKSAFIKASQHIIALICPKMSFNGFTIKFWWGLLSFSFYGPANTCLLKNQQNKYLKKA